MFSIGIIIKLAILFFLIKYLLHTGKVKKTAIIYSLLFAIISTLFGFESWSVVFFAVILIDFVYDFLTGWLYFYLVDMFQDSYILFYIIIIFGVVVNFGVKIFLTSKVSL